MKIENRCPHSITLADEDGSMTTIEKTRPAVRIKTNSGPRIGKINGVPTFGPPRFERILNLPTKRQDVVYVVSQLAALAIASLQPDRDDVFYPGTSPDDRATRADDDRRTVTSVGRLIRAV